jgi:hypothetical protein
MLEMDLFTWNSPDADDHNPRYDYNFNVHESWQTMSMRLSLFFHDDHSLARPYVFVTYPRYVLE